MNEVTNYLQVLGWSNWGVPAFAWRVWLQVSTCSPWASKFNWFPARALEEQQKKKQQPKKNSQPICVLQTPKKGWWLSACAFFCVLVLLVWALCFVQVVFVSQPKLEQKIMEVKPAKPGHFSMDLGEPTSQARLSEWRVWPYIFLGKL